MYTSDHKNYEHFKKVVLSNMRDMRDGEITKTI